MKKKYILFLGPLVAFFSQASAGNLLEGWKELETIRTKAKDPAVQDFMADFLAFKVNNRARTAAELEKFKAANEPLVQFQRSYGHLASFYRTGGAPDDEASARLRKDRAGFKEKFDRALKKWKFLQDVQKICEDTPDDKTAITSTLDNLADIWATFHSSVGGPTEELTRRQKRDVSLPGSEIADSPEPEDVLAIRNKWFLEKMGIIITSDTPEPNEMLGWLLGPGTE